MLLIICAVLLRQGLPTTIDPPRPDPRMILTKPSPDWSEWRKFMGTPPTQRRAVFDKLPPEVRRGIVFEHLSQVRKRHRHTFTQAEIDAIAQFVYAAEPPAFGPDEHARENFRLAYEHLLKTLSPAARKDMEALFPVPDAGIQAPRDQALHSPDFSSPTGLSWIRLRTPASEPSRAQRSGPSMVSPTAQCAT